MSNRNSFPCLTHTPTPLYLRHHTPSNSLTWSQAASRSLPTDPSQRKLEFAPVSTRQPQFLSSSAFATSTKTEASTLTFAPSQGVSKRGQNTASPRVEDIDQGEQAGCMYLSQSPPRQDMAKFVQHAPHQRQSSPEHGASFMPSKRPIPTMGSPLPDATNIEVTNDGSHASLGAASTTLRADAMSVVSSAPASASASSAGSFRSTQLAFMHDGGSGCGSSFHRPTTSTAGESSRGPSAVAAVAVGLDSSMAESSLATRRVQPSPPSRSVNPQETVGKRQHGNAATAKPVSASGVGRASPGKAGSLSMEMKVCLHSSCTYFTLPSEPDIKVTQTPLLGCESASSSRGT